MKKVSAGDLTLKIVNNILAVPSKTLRDAEDAKYAHHLAGDHRRPLPQVVLDAAQEEIDPDRQIVLKLGTRSLASGTMAAPTGGFGDLAEAH